MGTRRRRRPARPTRHGRPNPERGNDRRIIEALDAGVFSRLCGAWTRLRWKQVDGQDVLALDGKIVRRARDTGRAAPHLVAALTHDTVWWSGRSRSKPSPNEIPALRDLLGMMDIRELVITADAMQTQRDIAEFITSRAATTCSP